MGVTGAGSADCAAPLGRIWRGQKPAERCRAESTERAGAWPSDLTRLLPPFRQAPGGRADFKGFAHAADPRREIGQIGPVGPRGGKNQKNRDFWIFLPFLAALEPERRPRGSTDLVGSIRSNSQPKRPDGDPFRAILCSWKASRGPPEAFQGLG